MDVTVKDILNVGGFKYCELIAGKSGLENIILNVTSMEVPNLAPWLNKGDFLITTGYSIKSHPNHLIQLINSMFENECAGLAIKTKYIKNINNNIINLCDKFDLPLFIIPNDMPHSDLTMPLSKLIIDQSIIKYEFSINVHNKFIDLELSNKGLDGISNLLYNLLKVNCYILNSSFEILSSNKSHINPDFFINSNFINLFLDFVNSSKLYDNLCLDNRLYNIRKIYLKSSIHGYLLYERPNISNDILNIIIDHASTSISLNLLKTNSLIDQSNRLDNILLMDIITDNIKSDEELHIRYNSLKWPSLPCKLVVIDMKNFKFFSNTSQEDDIHNTKHKILDIINNRMDKLYCEYKTFFYSDNFLILTNSKDYNLLNDILLEIMDDIKSKYSLESIVGLSNTFNNYFLLKEEYENAKNAIAIGKIYKSENIYNNSIYDISNLNLEYFLIQNKNNDLIQNFIKEYLFELRKYDSVNNTNLYNTLFVYVKNGGNSTASAKELFIHRNTMNYRLNQCSDITKKDLYCPETLFNFYLAFKIQLLINYKTINQ